MRLTRPKARVPYVPVASFGDIAFLLIIFFMVASVFMREKHIEVTAAGSPDIDKHEIAPVSVVLDTHGKLWLQGQPCPPEALEAAVSALLTDGKDKTVMLKIDKDQKQETFGEVLLALSGAGADILMLGEKTVLPQSR